MKTLSRFFALAAAGLFLNGPGSVAGAAPVSPVGSWDFIMTGKQRGVTFLTFDSSYGVVGTEILRPAPRSSKTTTTSSSSGRGGDSTRSGTISTSTNDTSTNSSVINTNFYGSALLEGVWTYDERGRIVGALNEIYSTLENVDIMVTNVVNYTNQVTSTNVLQWVKHTNGISFRATVTATRLTMNAYTPRGLSTFKGVPLVPVPDYSANYFGVASKDRPYVEFFSTASIEPSGHAYDVLNGFGPAYTFDGSMLVSKQKQVAILTLTQYGVLSAITGAYKTNRFTGANAITGDLRGTDGTYDNFVYKLTPRP